MITNITQFCRNKNLSSIRSQSDSDEAFYEKLTNLYIDHTNTKQRSAFSQESLSLDKKIVSYNQGRTTSLPEVRTMHIVIDSLNRDISRGNETSIIDFGFVLSSRNDRSLLGSGRVPARLIPADITFLRIDQLRIPFNPAYTLLNTTRELSLTFTGIRSNGAISSSLMSNETIHFNFSYQVSAFNDNIIELEPSNKYCRFDPPLTYLDDISIRWSDPRFPIEFDIDRLKASSINYNSIDGRITFAQPHKLVTGDVVIVNGLSANTADTSIINVINSQRGHSITRISDTIIAINVNFTLITSPDNASLPMILFLSKCFRIPIEIGFKETDHDA